MLKQMLKLFKRTLTRAYPKVNILEKPEKQTQCMVNFYMNHLFPNTSSSERRPFNNLLSTKKTIDVY